MTCRFASPAVYAEGTPKNRSPANAGSSLASEKPSSAAAGPAALSAAQTAAETSSDRRRAGLLSCMARRACGRGPTAAARAYHVGSDGYEYAAGQSPESTPTP